MPAELTNFFVTILGPVKLIGKEIRCAFGHPDGNPIPSFWEKCHENGTMDKLESHGERVYKNAVVGWMGDLNPIDNTFSYIVGVFVEPEADVPDDMVEINIPKTRWAVGTIKGTEPDIYTNAHILVTEEMKKRNLQFNSSLGFEMEWYDERFCQNEQYNTIDLYISVI